MMTMPDQIFINIAVLAVGVAIGALLGETSRQRKDRPKDLSWENLERVKVTIICEAMALVLSGEYEGGKQTDGNVHGNL